MKWLWMLYAFVFYCVEDLYFWFRCKSGNPKTYDDWPKMRTCLSCGKRHHRKDR